jgi:hypothetical protein
MKTIVCSGGALTVFFGEIGDCPAHWVADWAVAARGGEGLMTRMPGPRSGAVASVAGTAGGVTSARRVAC